MRKFNLAHESATARGQSFNGLPQGYTHFNLCDDLDAAGRHVGLSSDAISLLRFLVKRTHHSDWQSGSAPVIGWSRFFICHELQWSEDKLARVEAKLLHAEMISFLDSPNCKRFTHRAEDGSLSGTSRGISLAPLGARAQELRALVLEQRQQARRLFEVFASLFAMRAALLQLMSHPQAHGQLRTLIEAQLALLPIRRDPLAHPAPLFSLAAETGNLICKLRAAMGLDDNAERAPTTHAPRMHTTRRAAAPRQHSDNCTATARPLYRKSAVQKEPDSNIHTESDCLKEVHAAPDGFMAYLQEVKPSQNPVHALDEALMNYARDMSIPPSVAWRLQSSYGRLQGMRSIFAVGRQIETGRAVSNPIGYAYAVARCPARKFVATSH